MLGGIGWIIKEVFDLLENADKIVVVAVLGMAGLVITTISGLWIKKVEKRHEVEAQFREQKVEMFNDFLALFDKLAKNPEKGDPEDLVGLLKKWQINLTFWGGPKVLMSFLALQKDFGENKTISDYKRVVLERWGSLVLAMRNDLGLSNRGLDKVSFAAHLMLRHGDVFLACLKENPEMTNDEFTELENKLNAELGIRSASTKNEHATR